MMWLREQDMHKVYTGWLVMTVHLVSAMQSVHVLAVHLHRHFAVVGRQGALNCATLISDRCVLLPGHACSLKIPRA